MISCPICQKESSILKTFAKRGSEELDLCRCKNCQHEFLHPFPSNEWLAEEYSQYYVKRQAGETGNKVEYFHDLFRELALNFDERKILEFGPGEGDAIQAAYKIGKPAQVTVVERNDEANALLERLKCTHHNLFLEEYLKSADEKFDYIFLFDVLEHLKDPVAALGDIKSKCLNPRGIIVATFPVADSASRKVLKGMWPQFKVEHLQYFTQGSLGEISQRTGLSLVKNEVLFKKLSAGYLLNVGKGFGPAAFKALTRAADKMVPAPVKKLNVTLGYGERLVLFQN